MSIGKVGSIRISDDIEIAVELDTSRQFVADVDGVEVRAASFEELEKQVRHQVKRQKVEHQIRLVIELKDVDVDDPKHATVRYVRAVLRGRNARTLKYLLTIDDKKTALQHLAVVAMSDDVTEEQLVGLNVLQQAADRAAGHVTAARREYARGKDLTPWELLQAASARIEGSAAAS